jgi:hypothetical protein
MLSDIMTSQIAGRHTDDFVVKLFNPEYAKDHPRFPADSIGGLGGTLASKLIEWDDNPYRARKGQPEMKPAEGQHQVISPGDPVHKPEQEHEEGEANQIKPGDVLWRTDAMEDYSEAPREIHGTDTGNGYHYNVYHPSETPAASPGNMGLRIVAQEGDRLGEGADGKPVLISDRPSMRLGHDFDYSIIPPHGTVTQGFTKEGTGGAQPPHEGATGAALQAGDSMSA